jgi:hypothetical protein
MSESHEPQLAQLRWVVDNDTLIFADGEQIKFPSWVPIDLIDRLAELPKDFYNLGNATADELDEARMARRVADTWKMRAERAEATLRDIRNNESNENILPVLMGDLETAINMIFRFAGMLGIQAGGELYDAINALANKYKMHYTPPKDYSYEGTVAPMLKVAGGMAKREFPILVQTNDDDFDYRETITAADRDPAQLTMNVNKDGVEIEEVQPPEADLFADEHEPDQQYGRASRDWVND